MSKKLPLKLNKVPIPNQIQILTHLYEEGADFIDIEGEEAPGAENDIIKVTVRPEYYTSGEDVDESLETDPEYLITEVKPSEEDITPISDNDINDLI